MLLSSIILLLELAQGIKASSPDSTSGKCGMRNLSPHISMNSDLNLPNFSPLTFRSNYYGFNKYNIDSHFRNYPVFNIKKFNEGKPDSITSGDLGTFYTFYRTFLCSEVDAVHQVDNKTFPLELWNLYKLKNDTLVGISPLRSYPSFVSINVLFEVGNTTSLRFNPIVTGITRLKPNASPQPLPYNYDLYALLPRESPIAVYETKTFPFPYPEEIFKERELYSKGCPPAKVHVYLKPITISQKQYDIVRTTQQLLQKNTYVPQSQNQNKRLKREPYIHITPTQSLVLRRRSISKAAAYILEFRRNSKGESELDPYSPDCKYLENIKNLVKGDTNAASGLKYFLAVYVYMLLHIITLII